VNTDGQDNFSTFTPNIGEQRMENTPKISYFGNKIWNAEISRTEKMFCAELFFLLKKEYNLLKFIKNFGLKPGNYDVGYEVAFYRDLKKEFTDKIKNEKGKDYYSSHRAFDLALFSENDIYIIEAKAQDGFNSEQLGYFEKDKKKVKEIIKEINPKAKVEVHLWALISNNYNSKLKGINIFDKIIRWEKIHELYGDDIFKRANEIYNR
jgi:hypothetical protein